MSENCGAEDVQTSRQPEPRVVTHRGQEYALLGYDDEGRPHYHLQADDIHCEHLFRVNGEYYRVGWLTDEQADEKRAELSARR